MGARTHLAGATLLAAGIAVAERAKWLADRGLSLRWNRQVPQIVAMAAPLLASPLRATLGTVADTAAGEWCDANG